MKKTMLRLRTEAQARGEKTFTREKPCPRGHLGVYYVASGICVACAKQNARNAFQATKQIVKQWRAHHGE